MTGGTSAAESFFSAAPSLRTRLAGLAAAAASTAPALVLGEPGTGRSSLARLLHVTGPRAAGPLVELDPAAIPTSLLESELFGYRAGAFSGAERSQAGRVARAEGGTLVLDHVEELPLLAQPKLLRLVAERRYAPLGGADTEANVRFVAVGAEDLSARVDRGAFRSDLYYRLEVLTFRLPPLRERREDLDALLASLLADLSLRFGRPGLCLASRARAWMSRYEFPGNVRELRNLLERAMLGTDGEVLDPPVPRSVGERAVETLEEAERRAILAALGATRGHQARAAELLGVSRKGLWEKRKRLGIP